jgi:hypothetical protein
VKEFSRIFVQATTKETQGFAGEPQNPHPTVNAKKPTAAYVVS